MPAITRDAIKDAGGRRVAVERTVLGKKRPTEAAPPPLRSTREVKRKLDELSSRVRRLAPPSAAAPETFYEERSEIAHELQKLAEQIRD